MGHFFILAIKLKALIFSGEGLYVVREEKDRALLVALAKLNVRMTAHLQRSLMDFAQVYLTKSSARVGRVKSYNEPTF